MYVIIAVLAPPALVTSCHSSDAIPAVATAGPPPGEVWLEPGSPKLNYVTVDTVRERRERILATLPAQLVMNEEHTVRVQSPVVGRIRSLDAKPGDPVEVGSPLAHISSSDIAQARSDLLKAEAARVQTEAALRRARDLFEHHVVAQREVQQAESDEAQARAEAARARARMSVLVGIRGSGDAAAGEEFVLRSPIRGEVIDRAANPGAEVRPDNGQILFTVSSLDTMWLTAGAYQRDLPALHRGQRVQFVTDALPGRELVATVTFVSSQLDPQTRTATVRAALANKGHALKAQTFGELRVFGTDSLRHAVVPSQALVTHGTETVVFLETVQGHFARRVVSVGEDDGQTATVLSGLVPGDRVVTRGSLLLAAEAERTR
ncbi:MAG: efflux RND transporter periplasmic adaptor subunit [Gemmatimonadota bacterium]|nr:efflux RND transporter periplasmic adaptor subunit [Gemmatimonadota bacterium]